MALEIIGEKCGMTRLYSDSGASIPVTVIHVKPNKVTQVKTMECDLYRALQMAVSTDKTKKNNKALQGIYAKASVDNGCELYECRFPDTQEESEYKVGDTFGVDVFQVGEKIDVTGHTKGKGFQGGIKRWNFSSQDNSHGNSLSHRSNGSIGQCQDPGKVWKGKKMSGHMGHEQATIQGLEVVKIDSDKQVLLIKGGVPGATGSLLRLRHAVKFPLAR